MSVLINNIDINSKYNCKVIDFNADATKFGSLGSYWPKKSLQGIRVNSRVHTFRNLSVTIHFYGEDAEDNIIRFIEDTYNCTFKYKDKNYDASIKEDDNKPIVLNSNTTKITLGYDVLNVYEDEKSITTNTNKTININSPKHCYANLEISSNTNVISTVISINDTDITVNNIKGNEVIYIGNGKIISNGKSKIDDVDIWEFPTLKPGVNNINVDRADVNVTVKYNERW